MIENWAYAALAEHIYRRNQSSDQALREADLRNQGGLINDNQVLLDLGAQNANRIPALNALGFSISDGRYIYNPATGFEATIAQGANGEFVIVFRGTDFVDAGERDHGDGASNNNLGWPLPITGDATIVDNSQWRDVKALTAFVIDTLAGGDSSMVSVTGQSLGGGLAGLASAAFGVKGVLISPAPFENALDTIAKDLALDEIAAAHAGGFTMRG